MPIIAGILRSALAWMLRGLAAYVPIFIIKALSVFGLAFVANEFIVGPILGVIQSSLAGAPAFMLECLAAMGFDKAITIMLSAHVVAMSGRLALRRRAAAAP